MSGLTALGDVAGGISQGIGPYLNYMLQQQGETELGNALSGNSSPQQNQGGFGSLISNLFGGQNQQQPQQKPPTFNPIPSPQSAPVMQPQQQAPGNVRQAIPNQPTTAIAPAAPSVSSAPQGTSVAANGGAGLQAQPQGQQRPPARPQGQQRAFEAPLDISTLPGLVQAIRRANPGISGRRMYQAVERALPLLRVEGLQQWRALQGQLGIGRFVEGYDRLAERSRQFDMREQRLKHKEQSAETYRTKLLDISTRKMQLNKEFDAKRSAILSDPTLYGKPERDAKLKALLDEYNKASTKLDSEIKALRPGTSDSSPVSEESGAPDIIYQEGTGKAYKYKGSGNRSDINNYYPLPE